MEACANVRNYTNSTIQGSVDYVWHQKVQKFMDYSFLRKINSWKSNEVKGKLLGKNKA